MAATAIQLRSAGSSPSDGAMNTGALNPVCRVNRTGSRAGMPKDSSLTNGWPASVRCSASSDATARGGLRAPCTDSWLARSCQQLMSLPQSAKTS
jgi:hypothetical protein